MNFQIQNSTQKSGTFFSTGASSEIAFHQRGESAEKSLSFQFQKSVWITSAPKQDAEKSPRLIDAAIIETNGEGIEIARKTSLLWSKFSKNIFSRLKNEENPSQAKETMSLALDTFMLQAQSDFDEESIKFLTKFIADLKEKPLLTVQSKYFTSGRESSLNYKAAVVPEMFRIFAGLEKEIPIETLLHNESQEMDALLSKQTEMCAMNRNEMLRLLAALKNSQREQMGSGFECYVLDTEELPEFLAQALAACSVENPEKIQLILRSDVHYTAVDLELKGEKSLALVMDAALDSRLENIVSLLEQTNSFAKIYVASGKRIQNDTFNCATFSFNQLCNSSKNAQIFERLACIPFETEEGVVRRIGWGFFPASLVKNAQSLSFIEAHPERDQRVKEQCTLAEYVALNTESRQLSPERTAKVNTAIERKFRSYASKVELSLKNMPREDLTKIVCSYAINDFALKHLN